MNVLAGNLYSPFVALIFLSVTACSAPTLAEQKAQILDNKIHFEGLTSEAFLETWGKPAYTHRERMQFYMLESGNSIPRFRTPMGEPPQGWTMGIISEDSVFFGYPDRGELLGFAAGRLVYREKVSADDVHALGKTWAMEERFKTRLESPTAPSPPK